ncbi:3-oxoacyl-[acyl-carrier protein] reductase [Desulfosalsimonas propionicica]|uniref:3-oxoacyl-[acyl-carrier protein] reductase n=1 Tax=Desulfosalsimonas propionicica TaxID=332175 RepID=A0A7W0HME0_9BACT|nr:3-oxoacyl-ACP reductase FabG [Desulfosalsimonas propionicica]MBA2882981.1 3-oxoacyl-[acyl-carrier protein] reductase [Desulfosalsimonas propionicica]
MLPLKGKVALVTGASRGLGEAIALCLGKAGANVAVTDLLIEGDADRISNDETFGQLTRHFLETGQINTKATADQIRQRGRNSFAFPLDVSKPDKIREAVDQIEKTLGTVDILVNNAGIMGNFGFIEKQDPEGWDTTLKVNLSGSFYCAQAVWHGMQKNKWGRIINISSITGQMGAYAQPAYGASKAGLIGLTRSLALEGARYGITVNALVPGLIDTKAIRVLSGENVEGYAKKRIPMQRLGRPDEVAQAVLFLASEMSSYITGASIPVTGGIDLMQV